MTSNTINDAQTITGEGGGMILAGRYRIVRQLGQGGMGSVWLAEDTQLDNKPFAIKMLPSILVSNKRAYRQLKDEALVAMKLTHPNIVTLRAFEENNGNPFLVMDYIDGQTLDDYLAEKGELSEAEVIRVLRPIAAALDYAHGEGVIHRDVKPANVMIRKDGHPFILDFGIAREIQETLTRVTGKLSSGTLLYMSPEQLNGEQPKPAQDIYSFAAMAYECLKGEPPFVRGAIEDQIKNKQPEPLPNSPSKIEGVAAGRGSMTIAPSVMAGLAKKPEDRPKSCVAVLAGGGFSRVERVDRVDGDGGARRPAEPGGSRVPRDRDDAPQSVGRRVPTPPPPVNDSYRVEHVRSRTPPRGDDVSRKECKERKGGDIGKVLGILALLAVLGGGGAWFYHQHQEQQRERARSVAEQKAELDELKKAAERKRLAEKEKARAAAERERQRAVADSGHDKVPLWEGGPYWADRNIGAERPEDYGYYFWWGDTVGYKRVGDAWVANDGSSQNFSFDNTTTYEKNDDTLKREGWITEEGVLAPVHDAAHRHWGDRWRMPTKQELDDLKNKCDWTWTTRNGVNGYVVRGRGTYTSYSIFLPAAGYGYGTSLSNAGSYGDYWSSVPSSGSNYAWSLDFNSSDHSTSSYSRYCGQSVRPVQGFTQ